MRIWTVCIVAALGAGLYPVASMSSPRCPLDFSIEHRLEAEREEAQNLVARERAAIEDLKIVTGSAIHERYARKEIDRDEFNRLFDQREAAMACLDADNALKDQQAYYTEQTKLIEAGCSKGPVSKMYVGWMREAETQKARACAKADLGYLTQAVKRLKEIQTDKLAKEEKSTPAIKTSDASQKGSRFCEQIRSASAHAATLFAAITKEKKDPWFIEPDTLGRGSKGIKLSAIVEIDEYVTSLVLDSQDFLSVPARCVIKIGTLKDIIFRVVPTYACEWNYDKTTRRQLEERTDRLFGLVRGCFEATTESGQFHRHELVADGAVDVSGDLYYGEGKPSRISLEIKKHTPTEDKACIDYSFHHRPEDKRLCMARLKPW